MDEEPTALQTPPESRLLARILQTAHKTTMQVVPMNGGAPLAVIDMTPAMPPGEDFLACAAASQLALHGYEILRADYNIPDRLSGFRMVDGDYTAFIAPTPGGPNASYVATGAHSSRGMAITVTTSYVPGRDRGHFDGLLGGFYMATPWGKSFSTEEAGRRLIRIGWMPILGTEDGLENGWHRHPYGITVAVRPVPLARERP